MTEIIVALKRQNQWIVTVQGEMKNKIVTEFRTKVARENATTARLEMNTYMLNRFTYWLKHQDFEVKYTEIF